MNVRVAILGSKGRMGVMVADLLHSEFSSVASLHAQADRGEKLEGLLTADVIIDFSQPEAMTALAQVARAAAGKGQSLPAFVIGSTGWTIDQRREVEELAKLTPTLMSSNFSTGVMAFIDILKQAAPLLEKLGYTPSIVEAHHVHKKDAPSGTALSIQRAISPTGPGNVQTHSVRAGEVIGDHEVTFFAPADRLVFGHFAQNRSIFARGAIQVGLWLAKKPRGQQQGLIKIDTYFQELKSNV